MKKKSVATGIVRGLGRPPSGPELLIVRRRGRKGGRGSSLERKTKTALGKTVNTSSTTAVPCSTMCPKRGGGLTDRGPEKRATKQPRTWVTWWGNAKTGEKRVPTLEQGIK